MIGLPELIAAVMVIALVLYAVLAGADFGGGLWDLLASGPRAQEQRETIEHSIAPVWEANHVWLILIVVLLFTGFPAAFASASIWLHVPLTAMLLGVVLRGSAFVFRKYDVPGVATRRWGRLFAAGSLVSPFFLGVCLAAISGGRLGVAPPNAPYVEQYVSPWLGVFPVLVGLLALALFAFVAAVYLTVEPSSRELRDDFRARALSSGTLAALLALATATDTALDGPPGVSTKLASSPLFFGLVAAALLAWVSVFQALLSRRYLRARVSVVALVTLMVVGWAWGQYPLLIAPSLTLRAAAAPDATLRLLVLALAAGALLLAPSLYALFRVFKKTPFAQR